MSRGKAVRGSSNDDLEEGQQNLTIRYGKIQFLNGQLFTGLFINTSSFECQCLVSYSKGTLPYFSNNGVIFISRISLQRWSQSQ